MFDPVAFIGGLTMLAAALIVAVILWAAIYNRVV